MPPSRLSSSLSFRRRKFLGRDGRVGKHEMMLPKPTQTHRGPGRICQQVVNAFCYESCRRARRPVNARK